MADDGENAISRKRRPKTEKRLTVDIDRDWIIMQAQHLLYYRFS